MAVGLTDALVDEVKAASVYHWIFELAAHVPANVAELPLQMLGVLNAVGAAGIGVTVTLVLAPADLQAVLAVLMQAA